MISAIVLCSDVAAGGKDAREIVVRSLAWLVSAVIAGVVRDVVLAAPIALDLVAVADRVGCEIVHAETEAERLRLGALQTKCERVLVIKAGFQPDGQLVEEIDSREHASPTGSAAVLSVPRTLIQRLLPDRAPVIGVLASRDQIGGASGFAALARAAKQSARLATRGRPIF